MGALSDTEGEKDLPSDLSNKLQVQGKLVCEWFDHPLCRYEHIWYQTITSFCPCGEKWATDVFCEWD